MNWFEEETSGPQRIRAKYSIELEFCSTIFMSCPSFLISSSWEVADFGGPASADGTLLVSGRHTISEPCAGECAELVSSLEALLDGVAGCYSSKLSSWQRYKLLVSYFVPIGHCMGTPRFPIGAASSINSILQRVLK